jgi:hypothetical protein
MRRLEKAKTALEDFETKDKPAFSQWFHSTFGALLSDIRAAEKKLADLNLLIDAIEEEKLFSGCTYRNAYQRVMNRRLRPESPSARTEDPSSKEKVEFAGEEDWPDADGPDEDMTAEELYEIFMTFIAEDPVLRQFIDDEDKMRDMFEQFSGRSEGPARESNIRPACGDDAAACSGRLKSLYRSLVRRLHPDFRTDENRHLDELWNDVQEAYKDKDLEKMEMLVALCDISLSASFESCSVSQLAAIEDEYLHRTAMLKGALRQARKDPAWQFANESAKTEELKREIDAELRQHLAIVRKRCFSQERILARWEEPAPNKKKSYEESAKGQLELFAG